MIAEKIKLLVSEFVFVVLRNDAIKFGYIKKEKEPNINGLLNKLIPNLVYYRKLRREEIHDILKYEYQRDDTEKIYECVNTIIDRVYFSDEELNLLEETVWLRPTKENMGLFDEIEESESKITGQSASVYIRGLLNEYVRLPEYKRETLVFDDELYDFAEAAHTGKIFHSTVNGKSIRMFAFHYVYGFAYDQNNYLIGYDLTNKIIGAVPLCKIRNSYVVERKYKPSERLISTLQNYYEEKEYDKVIAFDEELC